MPNKNLENAPAIVLSNKSYDVLMRLVKYALPALATLYFTVGQIWGFPYGEEVVGTIAALTTFLGVLLGVSKHKYENLPDIYDGELLLDATEEGEELLTVALDRPIEELQNSDQVEFKVVTRMPWDTGSRE